VAPPAREDKELLDYEASPESSNMEINVVCFSDDYLVISEEETDHLEFGAPEAVFQKPKESHNHMKALYMREHINRKPVSRMLVDSGAIVNLMPYSLYKKHGRIGEELIKTNMMVSSFGGGDPIGAKGVASMELTIRSTTVPIASFVSEVQCNLALYLDVIGFIPINACHLPCISFLFSRSAMKLRWCMVMSLLSLQLPIQSLSVHTTISSAYRAWTLQNANT
jgi:hypothetical protein